ncbi:MAG: hypothetical protein Q9218_006078 [Villophora microphyllina]
MSFVSALYFIIHLIATDMMQKGTFIGVYVEFATFSIKKHVAAGTTSRISRMVIEEQILESLDKAELSIEHKMACYMAILQFGTFSAFWAAVQLEHSLPHEAIVRYGIDYTLIMSDENFDPEIVDGNEVGTDNEDHGGKEEGEDSDAKPGAAKPDGGETSEDESSDEDDSETENLSPKTPVDLPAIPVTLSKKVQHAKPKNNRKAGPMAKKAGITKPTQRRLLRTSTALLEPPAAAPASQPQEIYVPRYNNVPSPGINPSNAGGWGKGPSFSGRTTEEGTTEKGMTREKNIPHEPLSPSLNSLAETRSRVASNAPSSDHIIRMYPSRSLSESRTHWSCSKCGWLNPRPKHRCHKCNSSDADEAQLINNAKQWKHVRRAEPEAVSKTQQAPSHVDSAEEQERRRQEQRLEIWKADRAKRLEQTKSVGFVGFYPFNATKGSERPADKARVVDVNYQGRKPDLRGDHERGVPVPSDYRGGAGSSQGRARSIQSHQERQATRTIGEIEPRQEEVRKYEGRSQERAGNRPNEGFGFRTINLTSRHPARDQARAQAHPGPDESRTRTQQPQSTSKPTTEPNPRYNYAAGRKEPVWSHPQPPPLPSASSPGFGKGWASYKPEEPTLTEAERSQRPAVVARASPPHLKGKSPQHDASDAIDGQNEARSSEHRDNNRHKTPARTNSEVSADNSSITWSPNKSLSSAKPTRDSSTSETSPVSRRQNIGEGYGDVSWLEATSFWPSPKKRQPPRYSQRDGYVPGGGTRDASSNNIKPEPINGDAPTHYAQSPISTSEPTSRQRSHDRPRRSRDARGDIDFAPSSNKAHTELSSYASGRASRRTPHRLTRKAMEEEEEGGYDVDDDPDEKRHMRREQRKKAKAIQKSKLPPTPIYLPEFISVSNLARVLKVRVEDFAKKMQGLGFEETNSDHVLDAEVAGLIAAEFNFEPIVDTASEDQDLQARPPAEDKSVLPPRPPIVTIMGHVDHGKTTLLDYLRKSSVAASEHGGITQHIGAFSVSMPGGRSITFLDTPGHAAFLSMRQRGANVTDIVILVVAADDSVKPQTVEAIKHAQAAKVPMIVAINKIDKEDKNIDRVKGDLARYGVEIEDYGGDTQVVNVSGKTGEGLDTLEEAIVAQSDIINMRAETDGQSQGWVLEATTKKAGRVATVLVRRGTIHPGDIIVAGYTWAKIRTLKNAAGLQVSHAGPGIPVEVDGWKDQPNAGDEVLQAETKQQANSAITFRLAQAEKQQMATDMAAVNESRRLEQEKREAMAASNETATTTTDPGVPAAASATTEAHPAVPAPQDTTITLPLILKADVSGSVEACLNTITALGNSKVHAQVLRSSVGPVSESDIDLALTSSALIISFNQSTASEMQTIASRMGVTLLEENIIYRLTDLVKAKLEGLLPPKIEMRALGEAEVAQRFEIGVGGRKKLWVAGCKVRNGVVSRANKVKVLRKEEVIFDGSLTSLKNVKKDVTEMRKGSECGLAFGDWTGFAIGDQVQCYEEKEIKQTL